MKMSLDLKSITNKYKFKENKAVSVILSDVPNTNSGENAKEFNF